MHCNFSRRQGKPISDSDRHISRFRFAQKIAMLTRRYSILAKVNGRTQIDVPDVGECESLFFDARRSAGLLSSDSGKGFIQ